MDKSIEPFLQRRIIGRRMRRGAVTGRECGFGSVIEIVRRANGIVGFMADDGRFESVEGEEIGDCFGGGVLDDVGVDDAFVARVVFVDEPMRNFLFAELLRDAEALEISH